MRLIIQRTYEASIRIGNQVTARIGNGLVVLAGISNSDTSAEAEYLANKLPKLRLFADESGRMNYNVTRVGGSLLIVPNFTLYGDCEHGLRPSFEQAAVPSQAEPLFRYFVERAKLTGVPVQTGVFGAHMEVTLVNDGPVTLMLERQANHAKVT